MPISGIPFLNVTNTSKEIQIVDATQPRLSLYVGTNVAGGLSATSTGSLVFEASSGIERARILSTGEFGIGTTSPSEKLVVAQSIDNDLVILKIENNFGNSSVNGTGTALQFYGWDAGITANIKSIRTGQAYSPSALTFETFGGSGTTGSNSLAERMRINEFGNVGIGTSTPARKLDVAGDLGIASSVNALRIGGNGVLGVLNGLTRLSGTGGASGGIMFTPNNDNTEKMRITSAGNVLIAKTVLDNAVVGVQLMADGSVNATVSEDTVTRLNRLSTDGEIIRFQKDTNSIGYIGSNTSGGDPLLDIASAPGEDSLMRFLTTGAERLRIDKAGAIKFNAYDGTNNAGTPTFLLGTDASGNVVKTNTIPGSGAGPYLPLSAGSGFPLTGDLYYNGEIRSTTPAGKLILTNNSTTTELHSAGTGGIQFKGDSNDVKMVILDGGNVGIGTTSPGAKLNVVGTGTQLGTTGYYYNAFFKDTTNSGVYLGGNNTNDGVGFLAGVNELAFLTWSGSNWGEKMRITGAGGISFGSTGTAYGTSGQILKSNGNASPTWIDGSAIPGVPGGSGTTNFLARWTPDGDTLGIGVTFDNGTNVGIGTTSPGAKLDVNGDVFINSNYTANTAAQDLTIGKTTTGDHGLTIVTSNANTAGIFFADNNNNDAGRIKYQHSNNSMRFDTNRSEAMRINSAGNVGIGTTSPDAKLEIADSLPILRLTDTRILDNGDWDDVSLSKIEFKTSDTTTPGARVLSEIEAYSNSSAASGPNSDLRFKTSQNTDSSPITRMTIRASGDVGIGTTNPNARLDVGGNLQISDNKINATNKTNRIKAQHYTNAEEPVTFMFLNNFSTSNTMFIGGGSTIENSVTSMQFYTGANNTTTQGSERMRITSDGNVGIGTTGPDEKLTVVGNIRANVNNGGGFMINGASASGLVRNNATGIALRTNTTDRLIINNAGNLQLASYGAGYLKSDGSGNITAAGASQVGPFLPLAGGTMTGAIDLDDDVQINFGSSGGGSLRLVHSAANSFIQNFTGDLQISNYADNKDILLRCDDGSGGLISYLVLDGSTTHAYFSNPGNVGIGVTNPHKKLTINDSNTAGEAQFGIGDVSSYYLAMGHNSAGNTDGFIGTVYDNDAARFDIRMKGTAQSDTKVTVLGSGNVGIGTASPTSNLDIFSTGTSTLTLSYNGGGGTGSTIDFSLINAAVSQPITTQIKAIDDNAFRQNLSFLTKTSATESSALSTRMIILANGNVGIGLTLPTTKLHVAGTGLFTGLVSGITPVAAANFVTKAYVDGSGGGTGPFLPLAGGTMTAGAVVTFLDSSGSTDDRLKFGDGGDLQIYHDGSNSYINESGTGGLKILAQDFDLKVAADNASMIRALDGGTVQLFFGGAKKFETTSSGVTVTGSLTVTNDITATGDLAVRDISARNLTLSGKGTSVATAASDGSTTLTTKSYVDGLVTGVPVYKGTWAAGTTGVTSAVISGTTIILTTAPTETIAIGDVVTADGITAAITVTAVASQTSVTVNASVAIASGVTVTFSPTGGYPDLTLAANKVLGNYYIVSTAGSAAPNGTGTEPDSWAVGDWCIFSDVTPGAGTDLWQRIDNSSVISGAGTGQTIPLWEGATNAVSETLGNSPITVSGNNSTFAGSITCAGLTSQIVGGVAGYFGSSTSINANQIVHVRDDVATAAVNSAGGIKISSSPGNDVFLLKRNAGASSFFALQNSSASEFLTVNMSTGNATFEKSVLFNNGAAFAGAGSIRQQSDILILTGGGNGFAFNDDTNAVSNLLINAGGQATFSSTVQATTYLVNKTSAAGIGTSLGDINGAELGPGYLTVSRDDTANAKQLSFYKNNVEHSYFETTTFGLNIGGTNVGIGTTSPSATLELNSATSNAAKLKIGRAIGLTNYLELGTSGGSSVINAIGISGVNASLVFNRSTTTATTQSMIIDGSGNVGIAVTGPSYKIEVNNTLNENIAKFYRTNSATAISHLVSTGRPQIRYTYDGQQSWYAGNNIGTFGIGKGYLASTTPVFNITSTENVGIGTATPKSKLQVAGGIQMADDTASPSADKVGTMRYRTGTEYIDVTGTDLVTNGDFAADTNWTKGTGVTIASGVGTWTNTANNVGLTQLITFTNNAYYRCNVTVSNYSSGSFRFRYPGISSPRITANGTYSLIIQANQATNDTLYLQGETNGDANVNFSIDNVSVVEVIAEDASYADMCMQTGASTYEWVNIVRNTY